MKLIRLLFGVVLSIQIIITKGGIEDIERDVQTVITEVNNIPNIVTQVNFVPTIVTGVNTIIPTIKDEVQNIPGINTVIKGINTTIHDTINELNEFREQLTTNPFASGDGFGDDATSLANTLKTCVDQIRDFIDPLNTINKMFDFGHVDIAATVIGDLAYKALAEGLLPLKSAVEFVCDESLPDAITSINHTVNAIKELNNQTRRRLKDEQVPPETDVCPRNESLFCSSKDTSYLYDTDEGRHTMYRAMVAFGGGLLNNGRDTSNTERYVNIRNTKLVFDIVMDVVEGLCLAISMGIPQIVNDAAAGGTPAIACGFVFAALQIMDIIFEYELDTAAIHDGEINDMRIKAIFNDRIAIIHNQKLLKNLIDKNALSMGFRHDQLLASNSIQFDQLLTSTVNISSQFTNATSNINIIFDYMNSTQYALEEIKNKIDNLQSGGSGFGNVDVEDEMVHFKLKISDLYNYIIIFIVIVFVWTVLFMMIGMLIMKCWYDGCSNKSHRAASVPTYDYSEDE
eukprot:49561_1